MGVRWRGGQGLSEELAFQWGSRGWGGAAELRLVTGSSPGSSPGSSLGPHLSPLLGPHLDPA